LQNLTLFTECIFGDGFPKHIFVSILAQEVSWARSPLTFLAQGSAVSFCIKHLLKQSVRETGLHRCDRWGNGKLEELLA
jgi:hypothetical protein